MGPVYNRINRCGDRDVQNSIISIMADGDDVLVLPIFNFPLSIFNLFASLFFGMEAAKMLKERIKSDFPFLHFFLIFTVCLPFF